MRNDFNQEIEDKLAQIIIPDLRKGRKNFDEPHTLAVVYWAKKITQIETNVDLDPRIFITAAYAHDWGYIGLFDGVNSDDINEITKRKPLHMDRGAEMITNLLSTHLNMYFNTESISKVAELVRIHDKVEELKTISEISIMEADTLGMLDLDRVKPTFDKSTNKIFIDREINGRRLPKFIHPSLLNIANEMLTKRVVYYEAR